MGRAPRCKKMGLKKGKWTPDEDEVLVSYIQKYGHGNWRALPKQAGLLRCVKSCRLRWTNYLRHGSKRGNYSKEEEDAIIGLNEMLDNRTSSVIDSSNCNRSKSAEGAPKKKYSITIDVDGIVGGPDAKHWSTRVGACVRASVPITFLDWRSVNSKFKDDIWNSLMDEFELNIESHLARPLVEKSFSQFFRTYKCNLRTKYLLNGMDKCDVVANCPPDVDKVYWEGFVNVEWEDKMVEKRRKNKENKAKNTISHTLGRKKYAAVYESLAKETPGVHIKRILGWKKAHTRKDGSILPSAMEKYNEILAEENMRSSHYSSNNYNDIEHDELTAVFGPEKKNRCRAMSSSSSVKQVKTGQAAKAITEKNHSSRIQELKEEFNKTLDEKLEKFTNSILTQLSRSQVHPGAHAIPNMTSVNLANCFDATPQTQPPRRHSASDKPYVTLLDRNLREVAKGYVDLNRVICHGVKVGTDERVVCLTEVMDPDSRIYENPQDGHNVLGELADGGFLRWSCGRQKFI